MHRIWILCNLSSFVILLTKHFPFQNFLFDTCICKFGVCHTPYLFIQHMCICSVWRCTTIKFLFISVVARTGKAGVWDLLTPGVTGQAPADGRGHPRQTTQQDPPHQPGLHQLDPLRRYKVLISSCKQILLCHPHKSILDFSAMTTGLTCLIWTWNCLNMYHILDVSSTPLFKYFNGTFDQCIFKPYMDAAPCIIW